MTELKESIAMARLEKRVLKLESSVQKLEKSNRKLKKKLQRNSQLKNT